MPACRYQSPILAIGLAIGLAGAALLPSVAAAAQEVDLSCMSHRILGKTQVSERYKEYDVILVNGCPGPVYWAMCIERLDPMTSRILETHTPTGYIEADQKIRVNLQMKRGPESMDFRQRFQEFYLATDYSIEPQARAQCTAGECEAARRDVRRRINANLQAWEAAETGLREQLATQCPESGWGKTEQVEECATKVRAGAQPRLDELAQNDAALREELGRTGPPGCELHAGDLVP